MVVNIAEIFPKWFTFVVNNLLAEHGTEVVTEVR